MGRTVKRSDEQKGVRPGDGVPFATCVRPVQELLAAERGLKAPGLRGRQPGYEPLILERLG